MLMARGHVGTTSGTVVEIVMGLLSLSISVSVGPLVSREAAVAVAVEVVGSSSGASLNISGSRTDIAE